MKILDNRKASFVLVTLVYIVAAWMGVLFYQIGPGELWLKLLLADVGATVVTFLFSLLFKNASVYDPYWSVQPLVILALFAAGQKMTAVKVLLLVAVFFWGIRLTANWAYTFLSLRHEDWRYRMLREKTGVFYPVINFVGIHMVPTLVVYGCTLPAAYVLVSDVSGNFLSVLGFVISLLAAILQCVSDIEMQAFRRRKTGGFIRTGLWKYSRHPNYLGEILMWWGVALAAISVLPSMWYLAAGTFANTLLFIFVSIPMAEKKQSKKEGFAEYKKQTRVLLPIKK